MNKFDKDKVAILAFVVLFWAMVYCVLIDCSDGFLCLIGVGICMSFLNLIFYKVQKKSYIKAISYIEMAEVYQMTPREHVDEILLFNQELCRYCRYDSSKGAVFFLDLSHLETMDFVKTTVGASILMRIKQWSMQAGNTTTACVFLQRDIGLSFRA